MPVCTKHFRPQTDFFFKSMRFYFSKIVKLKFALSNLIVIQALVYMKTASVQVKHLQNKMLL